MISLILRPSGEDRWPWLLQLRHSDPVETNYHTLARVSRETASAIVGAGAAHWMFKDPGKFSEAAAKRRIESAGMKRPNVWPLGTRVRKIKGSSWQGPIVGYYSTNLTPDGYCVESEREPGSVQIYPAAALKLIRAE